MKEKKTKKKIVVAGEHIVVGPKAVPTSQDSIPFTKIDEVFRVMRKASSLGTFTSGDAI